MPGETQVAERFDVPGVPPGTVPSLSASGSFENLNSKADAFRAEDS